MNITSDVVREVIDNEKIFVEFQPIISLNTKKIIGLEALARGEYDGEVVSPFFLFSYARDNNCTTRVDRMCREKALKAFTKETAAPTLFVNFETSVLNDVQPGNGELLRTVTENGIAPENVVIELNESYVKDPYNLLMFVDFYRSKGFLIAIDNVGNSPETQNRLMLVTPDIIKIDRAIISNIESNTYNQEVLKTIVGLARKIGAMTIAEGVETVDEVVTCMLIGVDYFQGFYFSKPEQFNYIFSNDVRLKLEDAALRLNLSIKNNPTAANLKIETYKRIIYDLVNAMTGVEESDYNAVLTEYVSGHSEIECAFLIDSRGFQITDTVIAPDTEVLEGYCPAIYGVNHDIKNYFYAVKEQIEDPFISGWHISDGTGKSCKTISSHFYNKKNEMVVACIDLKKK